jgi:hypothetical protein
VKKSVPWVFLLRNQILIYVTQIIFYGVIGATVVLSFATCAPILVTSAGWDAISTVSSPRCLRPPSGPTMRPTATPRIWQRRSRARGLPVRHAGSLGLISWRPLRSSTRKRTGMCCAWQPPIYPRGFLPRSSIRSGPGGSTDGAHRLRKRAAPNGSLVGLHAGLGQAAKGAARSSRARSAGAVRSPVSIMRRNAARLRERRERTVPTGMSKSLATAS